MIVANNIIQWDIFFPSTRGRFLSIVIQLHYILANVYRSIYTPVSWLKAPLLSLRWALHDFKIYTICILGIDLQWSAPSFSQKFNLSNKLRMPTDSIGWPWLNTWPPSLERIWVFFICLISYHLGKSDVWNLYEVQPVLWEELKKKFIKLNCENWLWFHACYWKKPSWWFIVTLDYVLLLFTPCIYWNENQSA